MDRFTLSLANGERLLDRALAAGIDLAHECGGALACASCCVIVREGSPALAAAGEDELDMLERAGVAAPGARLACQAIAQGGDVMIELAARDLPHAPAIAGDTAIFLTENAARHFTAQLARHPGAIAVRLRVEAAGCSGFGYRVDPASEILPGDAVFDSRGIRIAVDAQSLPAVRGATLDVVQEGLARRLRFDNPNARQSCGCGESFGV
jgi:iron-sulfur cluster assembly protein